MQKEDEREDGVDSTGLREGSSDGKGGNGRSLDRELIHNTERKETDEVNGMVKFFNGATFQW